MIEPVVIGPCTLYNADCRDVLPTLGGVDCVVTDPPYGTDVPEDGYGRRQLGARHIEGDGDLAALSGMLPLAKQHLRRADGWVVLYCSPKNRFNTETVCRDAGLAVIGEVVWDKLQPGLGGGIRYQHETVLLASFGKPSGRCPLFTIQREWVPCAPRKEHPHEKPQQLTGRLVKYSSDLGDTILDPFMGSGTTGVAAVLEGRQFIGCEIDPQHFATACRRIRAAVAAEKSSLFPAGTP